MNLYRALKYRNCRLFFPGLLLSQIGIWYQNIAISWLILEITKSPLLMGGIAFLNALPLFLLTPFAGVITDKYNKQHLLLVIQILFTIQALFITIISVYGFLNLYSIVLSGILLNCIIALDTPLRQSVFASLVDNKNDLSNAIALNSACFNSARLIGPAAAGIILANYSASACFFINFLLVIPALILISKIRIKNITENNTSSKQSVFQEFKEGLSYIKKEKIILIILIVLTGVSLAGMTYPVLMPIYTKNIFNANSDILGFLMASTGFGALCSSFILASKKSLNGLKTTMITGVFLFGASFICMSFSVFKAVSIITAFFLGAGMTASITGINTILQSIVEDNKRGRLMSIYTICYLGSASISNLLAGTISEYLGINGAFIFFGSIILIISLILFGKIKIIKSAF